MMKELRRQRRRRCGSCSIASARPQTPSRMRGQVGAPANSDAASPTATEFPIHVPVWVEAPAEDRRTDSANGHETAIVAIVPARQDRIAEIAKTLPKYAGRCRIVVVGDGAAEVVSHIDDPHVIAADLADESAIDTVLAEIDRFGADVILALESITAWDRVESLTRLATDNSLCELLFLIAQRNVARLKRGELELWGLFPDGWNGAVHAATGPVVGLLKAIAREIAGARVGVVSTRGRTLGEAVECVRTERSQDNSEPEVVYDGTTRLVRRLREARRVTEGGCAARTGFPFRRCCYRRRPRSNRGSRGRTAQGPSLHRCGTREEFAGSRSCKRGRPASRTRLLRPVHAATPGRLGCGNEA